MTFYRYLPYTLTLKSRAIITALGGDPNSSSTLPFIPGASVRGAVARVLGDPGTDSSKQQEFYDLVLGGRARYLHAYPSLEGRRALPVPVSLRQKKDEQVGKESVKAVDLIAFDGLTTRDDELDECWPKEQLARLGQKFLTIGAAQPTLLQPKMSARIHHQRDREKGRAWKDQGGNAHGAIFTFESLDAGQSFQGLIQVRADSEKELEQTEGRIRALLGDTILVGRSRRAGYGGMAKIQWESGRKREIDGVGKEGARPLDRDISQGERFRLLLTSACIARSADTGQIDPAALEGLIARLFDGRVTLIRRRWSFEHIGGFNRKWRLEVPQVLAISAGSVFLLEANQELSVADLRRVENEGLGERKEEGYGRVLFLDAPLQEVSLNLVNKRDENEAYIPDTNRQVPLVSEIERRIVRAQVARKIEEEAAEFAQSAQNLPNNSLIGRLRTPLRGKPDKALQTLNAWLKSENEAERLKRPAMEQLERCRIGNSNLADWILAATNGKNTLSSLKADVLAQRYHVVSEESAKKILEDGAQEISARLIDAVLAALAVRNRTKEAGDER